MTPEDAIEEVGKLFNLHDYQIEFLKAVFIDKAEIAYFARSPGKSTLSDMAKEVSSRL